MGVGLSLIIRGDLATANTSFWASLQNHTITEWVRLGGTSEDHLAHHHLAGSEQGQLLQTVQNHDQVCSEYQQG